MKTKLFVSALALILLIPTTPAFSESVSFKLSVTIPAMIQLNADLAKINISSTETHSYQINPTGTQMVQEQQMVRNERSVLVRSIVAL